MAGDRAESRLDKIRYVFFADDQRPDSPIESDRKPSQDSLANRLVVTGTPGDYVIHGCFYRLGGKPMVIAVQLLLSFVSVLCIFRFALLLGCTPRFALLAVLIYMVLPGSLILPHQLASESLYNPLVIIGLYLLCNHLEEPFRFSTLLVGLLLLAVAIGVRVQLVLYPFLLAPILAYFGREKRLLRFSSVIAICFLIPLSWALFIQTQTGQMRVKSHDNNPAKEFFKTAEKMALIGGFEFEASSYPTGTMPMGEFLSLIGEHPSAYARLKTMHIANLLLNPGIYSLLGHHLGMLEGAGDTDFWKGVRNREGYSGVIREIMRRGPFLALAFALSLTFWGLVLIGATCGLFLLVRNEQPPTVIKAILLSFALYSCLIVQVSTDVRWGHRTPIEFFIVILCAIALERLWQRRKNASSPSDSAAPS